MVAVVSAVSGEGKSFFASNLAFLAARQGQRVRVFKCGPDFIDPMLLERACGSTVHTLDLWMVGLEACRRRLLDAARDEILGLNLGRVLPDGTAYRGGGFPAGWDVIVPAAAVAASAAEASPTAAEPSVSSGHVVVDGESYWSISEAHLPVELRTGLVEPLPV